MRTTTAALFLLLPATLIQGCGAYDFTGYYDTRLPAASSPGRVISLELEEGGKAVFTTDFMNFAPEITQIGSWKRVDNLTVDVTFPRFGGMETMRFRRSGEQLSLTDDPSYGTTGLILLRNERPATTEKELHVLIDAYKVDCSGVARQKCYRVQWGDKTAAGTWQMFQQEIEGFTFREGTVYRLSIVRRSADAPPADGSRFRYQLKTILSEEPVVASPGM